LAYLKDTHDVTVEMVNQLYEFGSFQYSCGVYPHAAELLYRFRVLVRLICLTIVPQKLMNTDHRQRQGA
jgi:hypothetical protein